MADLAWIIYYKKIGAVNVHFKRDVPDSKK